MDTKTAPDEVAAPVVDDAPTDTLTAADRCDTKGCGAQAYVSALFAGSELLFCFHHYKTNEEKINKEASIVVDETYKLFQVAKLDVSA